MKPAVDGSMDVSVNPGADTNLETDANWATPDPASATLGWQIAAASVCGTSHQRHGVPCQDAHAWEVLPSGAIVIAVADGAGSAVHSDRGSLIAVHAATEFWCDRADELLAWLHQQPEGDPLDGDEPREETDRDPAFTPMSPLQTSAQAMLDYVLQAISQDADQENWSIADLATTLVVVVADDQTAIALQVGDGVVIVNDTTDQAIALTRPNNGEYANETTFVTSHTRPENTLPNYYLDRRTDSPSGHDRWSSAPRSQLSPSPPTPALFSTPVSIYRPNHRPRPGLPKTGNIPSITARH
ncbi:MAG: protein phosphatase 2C domain-containing protein [Coleofasciculaceae cyanobacterium RL_1_1]|nr:protein phosphatase 2C domain-containing protein [Coleofasciculaceae cyanobacterium RL_1_1]